MKPDFYFGAMFFQVHALYNYLFAPSSILVSVTFTEVLMKDLVCMLIRVCKIKNCRLSFKMLLSMCLIFVVKGFEHSCGLCLGEAKVSTVKSDLTNFVDAQCLNENIK